VARDHTWVWGTGNTADTEIGRGAEAVVLTLGDGVNQNAYESLLAAGAEYNYARRFTVYALTHPDILVDYRFKTDGDSGDLTRDVTVDNASACSQRFAVSYNSSNAETNDYPRPIWSARYNSATAVRLQRRRSGDNYAAWVQGIQMCMTLCP
jgi:hypothetical protein